MFNINLSFKELLWIIFGVIFIVVIIIYFLIFDWGRRESVKISNFEDCMKFSKVVMESYPRQCNHDGINYTEDIGNELEKVNLIQINSPRPNQTVSSPVTITGKARGSWFFEGSFPITIQDENGQQLGVIPAKALGEWMTTSFVPFSAQLEFATSSTKVGTIKLKKDNPSGLPENDNELIVPINFGN